MRSPSKTDRKGAFFSNVTGEWLKRIGPRSSSRHPRNAAANAPQRYGFVPRMSSGILAAPASPSPRIGPRSRAYRRHSKAAWARRRAAARPAWPCSCRPFGQVLERGFQPDCPASSLLVLRRRRGCCQRRLLSCSRGRGRTGRNRLPTLRIAPRSTSESRRSPRRPGRQGPPMPKPDGRLPVRVP